MRRFLMASVMLLGGALAGACTAHDVDDVASDPAPVEITPLAGETPPEQRIHCRSNCHSVYYQEFLHCKDVWDYPCDLYPGGGNESMCRPPEGVACIQEALYWRSECYEWCEIYPF